MKSWLFPLWVIIDLLLFVSVLSLWITAPEHLTLNIGLTVFSLALGLVLLLMRREQVKIFVTSTYFKKVALHGTNVLLVLSILALVNYLGNKNFKEFDMTKENRNSLTDQTSKVLEMVKSPLTITVFSRREEWQGILTILKLYEAKNQNIKLSAIDTDLRPDLVKQKGIAQNGTVVISYEGKESQFVVTDELSITNALLKALRSEKIVLYFVTGHDELSCGLKNPEGISIICERLQSQNYEVRTLNLTQTKEVPQDASAVFVLGPTSAFLDHEVNQLKAYLARGGSMFLSLAPAFKANLYQNLIALAAPYGLTMGKDIVIDRLSTVQGAEATIPIVNTYDPEHPVTMGFTQRTIFPLSASVQTLPGNDIAELLALTSSFPGSWAETDLRGVTEGKAAYKEGEDLKGPVGLLGVGESTDDTKASRFVLLGSSSFLINAHQPQSGNSTLFLNSVSWLINDEGIISFNRPGLVEDPVILSAQHLQMIFVISIFLVPLVFFGSAIFIYRRRRLL